MCFSPEPRHLVRPRPSGPTSPAHRYQEQTNQLVPKCWPHNTLIVRARLAQAWCICSVWPWLPMPCMAVSINVRCGRPIGQGWILSRVKLIMDNKIHPEEQASNQCWVILSLSCVWTGRLLSPFDSDELMSEWIDDVLVYIISLELVVGGLGFDFCVFVIGWRYAVQSEAPF